MVKPCRFHNGVRLTLLGAAAVLAEWVDPCTESPVPDATEAPDHSVWREVLQQHVSHGAIDSIQSTLVDYAALRSDPARLRDYLRQLCAVDLDQLNVAARTALLINAYNAMLVAIVVAFRPVESVLEVGDMVPEESVWKHPFITLASTKVSPDDVEHTMLRNSGLAAQAGVGGRLHAGVVCASLSCPDLQPEPFLEATLEQQLTDAMEGWLANPSKNPGPGSGSTVDLSMIFHWYGGDFVAAEGSVEDFVRKYAPWDVPSNSSLDFIPYNWGLNAMDGALAGAPSIHSASHTTVLSFPLCSALLLAASRGL